MSCPAHLAVGPIVIVPFLARLAILPWGNRQTYSISCPQWILCASEFWPLLDDHVNAISKHVCGTLIIDKNIWSTMLNFLHQLFKHHCLGNVILLPLPEWFPTLYPVMDIMLCLSLGRIYPWNMCLNTFSFPLFCLIFLVIYIIWALIFHCLCKHLGVQFCQQDPVAFVDSIPVTTDGWELSLLVSLVQRSGKWFSSSLALGTDVVADITNMRYSDLPCYLDRANWLAPSWC